METAQQWARVHLENAWVGDKRRGKRLARLGASMARNPAGSLPVKCGGNQAELAGAYRLLNNKAVEPEMILSAHRQEVLRQCREHAVVLCIQDTTELDYTGAEVEGLGQIGNGHGRGLLQHSALASVPGKGVLGLLHAAQVLRPNAPKGETPKQLQSRWTEAMLWGDMIEHTASMDFGAARVVHIGDRGSDRADFLFRARDAGQDLVVRASYDRKAHGDIRLWEHMQKQPPCLETTLSLKVRKNNRTKATREAKLRARSAPVEIPPPIKDRRYEHHKPLKLWAVYLAEYDTPAGSKPLEWMLLTSLPVSDEKQTRQIISYYEQRWQIEEWHRCIKQGCALESAQLKSADAIRRLAMLSAITAVRLLQLRDATRESAKAPQLAIKIMPPMAVKAVALMSGTDEKTLSAKTFLHWLAKRGGWLGRKNDSPPGWQALWRGWQDLELIITGLRLATNTMHDL